LVISAGTVSSPLTVSTTRRSALTFPSMTSIVAAAETDVARVLTRRIRSGDRPRTLISTGPAGRVDAGPAWNVDDALGRRRGIGCGLGCAELADLTSPRAEGRRRRSNIRSTCMRTASRHPAASPTMMRGPSARASGPPSQRWRLAEYEGPPRSVRPPSPRPARTSPARRSGPTRAGYLPTRLGDQRDERGTDPPALQVSSDGGH
jgi:hypothetical protein